MDPMHKQLKSKGLDYNCMKNIAATWSALNFIEF